MKDTKIVNNELLDNYKQCKEQLSIFKNKVQKNLNKSLKILEKLCNNIKKQAKDFGFIIDDKMNLKENKHTNN